MSDGKIFHTVSEDVADPRSPPDDGDLLGDNAHRRNNAPALPLNDITAESTGLPLTHRQIRRRVISGNNFLFSTELAISS